MNQRSESRQRTKLIAIRLLPAEYAALKALAAQADMGISAYVRDQALVAALTRQPGAAS